jgi:ABC-type lipoprotein release transport system permease subunit
MTFSRLLRRSLFFYRRANLAVLLGVAVGTAVLIGALLVGDSLRGSLQDRALRQLGGFDAAMVSGRFVRAELADDFRDALIERGIALHATAERESDDPTQQRSTGVSVWAVQGVFSNAFSNNVVIQNPVSPGWRIWQYLPGLRQYYTQFVTQTIVPVEEQVSLSPNVALALDVKKLDDKINLRLVKQSNIPRESALGRRSADETAQRITAAVRGILPNGAPASDFSLAPGIQQPSNVFVNLGWLQNEIGEHGKVNVLLANGRSAADLQKQLRELLTLDDWGLTLKTPELRADDLIRRYDENKNGRLDEREWKGRIADVIAQAADENHDGILTREELLAYYQRRGIVTLESRELFIEPAIERAALDVVKEMGVRASPTLVYLANSITAGGQSIPYSVVGALDPKQPSPLGPFLPSASEEAGGAVALAPQPRPSRPDAPDSSALADDEIVLAKWHESPLMARPGDEITITYFDPNQEGQLNEKTAKLGLRGFVALDGPAADPNLSPDFPGITDKLGLRDWDPPFPYDNRRITKRDEDYWAQYRTTPKAYVTLATGKKLFGSRFGDVTSIRLAIPKGQQAEQFANDFGQRLLKTLRPEQGGFVFQDVRERALQASRGGMDFGLLFLGFSMFLIAAALLLVGLLVRLALDQRGEEVGLLLATGYRTRTVRRLLLTEGLILAALGGILGIVGAIGYAALMLKLFASLWPEGSVGSFLGLHVRGTSVAIGYVAALVVSSLTIWWAVRALNRVAPSALLAGAIADAIDLTLRPRRRWPLWLAIGGTIAGLGLIVGGLYVTGAEERAGSFFSGGMLLLVAALTAVGIWLRGPTREAIHPGSAIAVTRLGLRNASRNPLRSLLTAALIASAAFLLVAVESFRRSPEADFNDKNGGSGGFAFVAETELPLYRDPASPDGRQDILDALEKSYQRDPATKTATMTEAKRLLDDTHVVPLRLRSGDDTSCLNLYQPGRPRLLGVPKKLIDRGGFRFAGTLSRTAEDRANPWKLLDEPTDEGSIPVFGDEHSVQWMLKSDLGGTIEVPDGAGRPVKLKFVGLLQDSVFQSELLMSDANFLKLFPRSEGFSVFLLDPPAGHRHDVTSLFQSALDGRGVAITPARDRLAAFLAVENTYLSTFQILGGFGLLLGALGLAVVLLRNVWERKGELALLRALGYRRRALGWMVFAENATLLILGLVSGIACAAAAVAPHVFTGEGTVPWARLGVLLGLVLAVGFAAGGTAVRSTVRAPLVPALRKE